jgi:predicted Zn-dependent protease
MGLAEFRLKDYDASLDHLQRSRQLGIRTSDELAPVVRYHAAILLTRLGLIDQALQVLNEFAVDGNDSPKVIEAFGIAALRLPMLPTDLPGDRRDAVMIAGRAQYFSAARLLPAAGQAFEQLVTRYPDTPNVHYACGVFLLGEEPDRGLEELQKELKVSPGHSLAMLAIAFEYIRRSDYPSAKTWAEKAVSADPRDFAAHKALGQVLLETGDADGAIRELENGVKLAPNSPVMHFQLAKAYQKAGRAADAERERGEFTRLDRAVRAARAGQQSVGGVEASGTSVPTPNQ